MRTRTPLAFRLLGRVGAILVALVIFGLVGVQFARVIRQNVALAQELSTTQTEITSLQARKEWQIRELRRLEDPDGAVPEIHERLRLVRRNEAIIFVSPAPSSAP
ncbi:MAG TPA: hypothetical protein VFN49_09380 [Candidatus Aquilonibacter sp.]|nr:hypothetical protein [Candidatus Aquilonibacter sp.]